MSDFIHSPGIGLSDFDFRLQQRVLMLGHAPVVAVAQTIARNVNMTNSGLLSSGRETMALVYIPQGQAVNGVIWRSGSTAAVAPTNQWAAIRDIGKKLLAVTADLTNTAWAATAIQTFTFATPFVAPYSGLYYVSVMVAAGTVPTLFGTSTDTNLNTVVPITSGFDPAGGLTTPATAPATAGALSPVGTIPYAYLF